MLGRGRRELNLVLGSAGSGAFLLLKSVQLASKELQVIDRLLQVTGVLDTSKPARLSVGSPWNMLPDFGDHSGARRLLGPCSLPCCFFSVLSLVGTYIPPSLQDNPMPRLSDSSCP